MQNTFVSFSLRKHEFRRAHGRLIGKKKLNGPKNEEEAYA